MDILEKLRILSDAAKYDVACTSSGVDRGNKKGHIGNTVSAGICHSFAADGRCISLLKVLFSNACVYDCEYCVNRRSNDVPRATFLPRELADLTINFYKRNYIEGLFLSSGVIGSPDKTTELMTECILILRNEYKFRGYIHVKIIPGSSPELINLLGTIVDRVSVNIEFPSNDSLKLLAPDKTKTSIFKPMGFITEKIKESSNEIIRYKSAPKFVPAGQSTQMIVGATPETDFKILNLAAALYKSYQLKRVFYSAYVPMQSGKNLPALDTKPALLREHRLYQADWLLRFYGFDAGELLDEKHQNFNPLIDPKCNWAINNIHLFPVEINTVAYEMLLRIPGVGVKSALKINTARKHSVLDFPDLKKIGVVLKRAQYFILCKGKAMPGLKLSGEAAVAAMLSDNALERATSESFQQLSFFDSNPTQEDEFKCLTGQM